MIIHEREVKESIRCWCGLDAEYHHISSSKRRDKKRTVWYRCPDGHRVYDEIEDVKKRY